MANNDHIPKSIKNQEEENSLKLKENNQPIEITYRAVRSDELDQVYKLESLGFPPDEAASLSTIHYRQSAAPGLFVGAYLNSKDLIGFINATGSDSDTLDHDSLTYHNSQGKNVMIHSVCVDFNYRRLKVATGLLLEYIERCTQAQFSSIILVCHDELKKLYSSVGFIDRGSSQLVHGNSPWFEMVLSLPVKNFKKLLCPVERCRCVILRKGVGRLITTKDCPLPEVSNSPSSLLPTRCWLVPSPTSFENIGFSKPVSKIDEQSTSSSSSPSTTNTNARAHETRWLSCGACDFGPLGWTESSANLAHQFSNNPTGPFSNVLFLLDSMRVFAAD